MFEQLGLYVLPLVGSTLLAIALFNLFGDLRKTESKRITERLKSRDGFSAADRNERAARESLLRQKKTPVSGVGGSIARLKIATALQRIMDQANIPWSATVLLINLVGLSAVAFIVGYFLKWPLWAGLCMSAAVLILPLAIINIKRNMRMNRFLNQLPDVFELMSQSLRAGHSLPNALMLVGQQMPDPVGTEFSRVFHEQNLGIKIEDALKDMARRIGLMDVRFFVTAVLIQRTTGGDLAEVLDNISSVIRDRIKLFGTVRSLTAEGRLSGWVLLALPIVVFVMELVVNPDYARVLIDEPLGRYMLIGAGIAQVLGLLMIQKIVNIKV